MKTPMTAGRLIAEAPIPAHEARRLLLSVCGESQAWLIGDPPVPGPIAARYQNAVRRRRSGEPLQYIEGSVQFGPVTLQIDSRALIPRPETERLWELATALVEGVVRPTIVDMCTGSGNLALALKFHVPDARVVGVDSSSGAVALAEANASHLGLQVDFVEGDLFSALDGSLRYQVDLLVSNPPYVAAGEWRDLPQEVRDHEPFDALVGGVRGTEILGAIAQEAHRWLRSGGRLICEIGETQGDECLELFAAYSPEIIPDLTGRPRYVAGTASHRDNLH